jgi:hypothetical protein
MSPIEYHEGQRAVQYEAKTDEIADKLASWVGPVVRYAELADLIVLAHAANKIQFTAISGKPPLLQAHESGQQFNLQFPEQLQEHIPVGTPLGGLVIFPREGRRSRFSGVLSQNGQQVSIQCQSAFTNCRKYIAPSISHGDEVKFGPRFGSLLT